MTGIEKYRKHSMSPFFDRPYLSDFFPEIRGLLQGLEDWPWKGEYRPAVTQWKEEEKRYVGTIELPGMRKEEIKVQMIDDGLEVIAEQYEKKDDKKSKSETKRMFRTYQHMPEDSDLGNVVAKYDNGILTLEVPRLIKPPEKKGIEIKVS